MGVKNTIIIFDMGEGEISFFVLEGDYSRLDRVWIGIADGRDKEQEELSDLFWDEKGEPKKEGLTHFPHEAYRPQETAVIICGFAP